MGHKLIDLWRSHGVGDHDLRGPQGTRIDLQLPVGGVEQSS